jgi:hypothetical protein
MKFLWLSLIVLAGVGLAAVVWRTGLVTSATWKQARNWLDTIRQGLSQTSTPVWVAGACGIGVLVAIIIVSRSSRG